MILTADTLNSDIPRISSNQLGEFIYATQKRKIRILYDQKFGNTFSSPYYSPALRGILRSLSNGRFSNQALIDAINSLVAKPVEGSYHQKKKQNNISAIENFMELGDLADPPSGIHRIITRNALIPLDGVIISARPEIISENREDGYAAFTKLRFSKSKVSADAQEIVLLILLHFGQQQSHEGLSFNLQKTRLIDCFSKTIISGHTIGRHRDQQLHQALDEISKLWPTVHRGDSE